MRNGSRLFGVALVAAAWVLGGEPQPRALAIDGAIQNPATNHWYKLYTASAAVPWTVAKANAEILGGYLVTLTSSGEEQWVFSNFTLNGTFWIGASDAASEGTWVWVTGEPWTYSNWGSGEPNNANGEHYAQANVPRWNDMADNNPSWPTYQYVVEWDKDPNGPPPPPPAPEAPSNLRASVSNGNPIQLSWIDNSDSEEGFEVERHAEGSTFALAAELGSNSGSYEDYSTEPGTLYTYRVRAVNSAGVSGYSNEAAVTASAIAPAPKAPTDLVVVSVTRDSVDLSWTDNSTNEDGFQVARRTGGGEFAVVAKTGADAGSFLDTGLPPDTEFVYGVRAVNAFRSSGFAEVPASTLPTLSVTPLRADLKDSPKFGKDSLKVQAMFDFLPDSPDGLFDPLSEGITLRAGDDAHPVVMTLPGGLDTWKVRGTKATWKSAKGSTPKYMIQVDLEDRLVKASATGLELAAPPANPMRVSVGIGNDAGTARGDWEAKKPGYFRLR